MSRALLFSRGRRPQTVRLQVRRVPFPTGAFGRALKRAPCRAENRFRRKTNGEQKMLCGAGNISVRTKCKALFERFRNAANTEKVAPPEDPDRPAAFGPLRQAGPGCALPPKACGAKGPFLIPGCKQQKRKRFGGAPGSLRDALGLVVVAFCWARADAPCSSWPVRTDTAAQGGAQRKKTLQFYSRIVFDRPASLSGFTSATYR